MSSPSAPSQPADPRNDERNLVIKVKYGDTLRRFCAYVDGQSLDHDMPKLRAKIINLFKLNTDADLILTYTDEDGDAVTLDNNEELHDAVVNQRLNPLRINAQLKTCVSADPDTRIASWSPQTESQPLEVGSAVDVALKSLPKPLRCALSKLSRVASSAAALAEVSENSKLLTNINPPSHGLPDGSQGMSDGPSTNLVDANVGDKPKPLVDPVPTTAVLGTTKSLNLEQIPKKNETQSSRTGTSTAVDINMDLSFNDLLSCSWTTNYKKELGMGGGEAPGGMVLPTLSADQAVDRNSLNYVASKSSMTAYNTAGVADVPDENIIKQFPTAAKSQYRDFRSDVRYKGAPTPLTRLFRRPYNYHATCHRGVRCDSCGMLPIMGPRFKSNVMENYDLCSFCFSEMGNADDYTRMERAQSRRLLKESYNRHSRYGAPSPRSFGCRMRSLAIKPERLSAIQSCFIKDVTIKDGTIVPPSTPFTKIWRMRNNGTIAWPLGTHLLWTGGHHLGHSRSAQLVVPTGACPVNQEIDIAVNMSSPLLPGWYTSYWKLALSSGQTFGELIWVQIQVGNAEQVSASAPGFPGDPESSGKNESGIIDLNAEPAGAVFGNPNSTTAEHESLMFPSDSTPWVFLDNSAKVKTANVPEYVPTVVDNSVDESEEMSLLKELAEMGFTQVDTNKDVFRPNENNIEHSVDEPAGLSSWDTLLEDLKELGFHDEEMNKKLLAKNDGSIKRAVLDLIAEEKNE